MWVLVAVRAIVRYIGRKPKQFQFTVPPGADMAQAMDKSAMERIILLADFPPSRFVPDYDGFTDDYGVYGSSS